MTGAFTNLFHLYFSFSYSLDIGMKIQDNMGYILQTEQSHEQEKKILGNNFGCGFGPNRAKDEGIKGPLLYWVPSCH